MKYAYLLFFSLTLSLWEIQPAKAEPDRPAALIDNLRQGGLVVFFRHAATDKSQHDVGPDHLADCAAQRNLSILGRDQAAAIGQAFRALGIPVGDVVSSRYCRCLDTLRIAFGRAVPSTDLTSIMGVGEAERRRRTDAIRRMLSTPTNNGQNNLLVSHKFMLHDASGLWLEEGDAGIARPLGNGRFEIIGPVKPADWEALAARFSDNRNNTALKVT